MINEYKKHLRQMAKTTAQEVASAFKIPEEEKIQQMEENNYKAKIKTLNLLLQNGLIVENNQTIKINAITKIDDKFYFVTSKGFYECDSIISRRKFF